MSLADRLRKASSSRQHDPILLKAADRIEALEIALRGISKFLENAPAESGVCCCGSPMDGHSVWDGHSPVDQFSYSASQWVDQARAIIGNPHERTEHE